MCHPHVHWVSTHKFKHLCTWKANRDLLVSKNSVYTKVFAVFITPMGLCLVVHEPHPMCYQNAELGRPHIRYKKTEA
jgi:hypothetical protein